MGNNGFCELTLRQDGGADVLFVDWLGARRCRLRLKRQGGAPGYLEIQRTSSGADCEEWERPQEHETMADLRARGCLWPDE